MDDELALMSVSEIGHCLRGMKISHANDEIEWTIRDYNNNLRINFKSVRLDATRPIIPDVND